MSIISLTPRTLQLLIVAVLAAIPPVSGRAAEPLQKIESCVLVPTDWADGDSFQIRTPAGKEHTIRLYGADCLEWHVSDESDSRRLRAQRQYFGISAAGSTAAESIEIAKNLGQLASVEVTRALEMPFTVHTSFADARGDGRNQRVYAFVTCADGRDLASHLVASGLARAFGVYRETPDGRGPKDYRSHLQDLEMLAAKRGLGIWARTNWDKIPEERQQQRNEETETGLAIGPPALPVGTKLDPNTAARDDLMKIPGIGETMANRIIAGRPYQSPDDLLKVSGIGKATKEKLAEHLQFDNCGFP